MRVKLMSGVNDLNLSDTVPTMRRSIQATILLRRNGENMNYRRLGRTNWQVSEVGYGMWGMAGWTGSDDEESRRSIDRAVELGCNFFDTAYAYGMGRSEKLLGEALRRHRGPKPYVATK